MITSQNLISRFVWLPCSHWNCCEHCYTAHKTIQFVKIKSKNCKLHSDNFKHDWGINRVHLLETIRQNVAILYGSASIRYGLTNRENTICIFYGINYTWTRKLKWEPYKKIQFHQHQFLHLIAGLNMGTARVPIGWNRSINLSHNYSTFMISVRLTRHDWKLAQREDMSKKLAEKQSYLKGIYTVQTHCSTLIFSKILTHIAKSWGQYRAHLSPGGPRWAPCWPHEPCYQGTIEQWRWDMRHSLLTHYGLVIPYGAGVNEWVVKFNSFSWQWTSRSM